jgi:cell division protein FtsX
MHIISWVVEAIGLALLIIVIILVTVTIARNAFDNRKEIKSA